MFREQYKADNEKIRPSEEKLKSLALLMQQEIENKEKYEKESTIELIEVSPTSSRKEKSNIKILPKRYQKPVIALVSVAASLAIVIGLLNTNPTVNIPILSGDTNSESSDTASIGMMLQTEAMQGPRDLETSLKLASQEKETAMVQWNPYADRVEQAEKEQAFPIYQIIEVDKEKRVKQIADLYGMAKNQTITATDATVNYPAFYEKDNNPYVIQVNKNGSYILSLVDDQGKPATNYSAYSEQKYKENVAAFLKKYGEQLNISNEKINYNTVTVEGTQYVNGAYIFREYTGTSAQCLVGFYEYIYIRLSDDGAVEYINDHQIEKKVIGEFKLLGKETAVQQYNSQNIYRVGDFIPSEPFGDKNSIWIEYAADASGKILQPVYFINQKEQYGMTETMCAIPAINGEVWSPDNVEDFTKPEEKPVVTPVPYEDISSKLINSPLTCGFSLDTVSLGDEKTIAMIPKGRNDYYLFKVVDGTVSSPVKTSLYQSDGTNEKSIFDFDGKSAKISNVVANKKGIYWVSPNENGTVVSFYSYDTNDVKVLKELGSKVSQITVSDAYICYRNKDAKDIFACSLNDLSKPVSVGEAEGTFRLPTQFTDKITLVERKDKKQTIQVVNLSDKAKNKSIPLQGSALENISSITVGEKYIVITCQKETKGRTLTKTYLYSLENQKLQCIANSDVSIAMENPVFLEDTQLLFVDQNGQACLYDIENHVYCPIQTLSEQKYQALKTGYSHYLKATDGKSVTMILPRSTDRYEGTYFDYAPNGLQEAPSMDLAPKYAKNNTITDAKVYNYIAVNQQKCIAEIIERFGYTQKSPISEQEQAEIRKKHGIAQQTETLVDRLVASSGKEYDVLVYPNGTYRMIASTNGEIAVPLSVGKYDAYTKALQESTQSTLGLADAATKYRTTVTANGETAVTGVYFFFNYEDNSERSLLGFREYLFASFDAEGVLLTFSDQRTQKNSIEGQLISKKQAIQLYQNNKAYRVNSVNSVTPQPDYKVGEPVLVYTADTKGTILQPVYYIPLLSAEDSKTVIGYAGVVAVNNGDLLSGSLLKFETTVPAKSQLTLLPVAPVDITSAKDISSLASYKVTEENQTKLGTEIIKQFQLTETAKSTVQDAVACYSLTDSNKQTYSLKINKSGSYELQSKNEPEVYDKETYEKNIDAFLKLHGEFLGITKEMAQYQVQIVNQKEYISGVYFIAQTNKVATPLSATESIYVSLNQKGELTKLENNRVVKEIIGTYDVMGTDEAIRLFNRGDAFHVGSKSMKLFNEKENTISLVYVMDNAKGILQPVYAICEKSAAGKQVLVAVVPAYNNTVWTATNFADFEQGLTKAPNS